MKLATDIKPRDDGTVTAVAPGGEYVFVSGADDDRLIGDVDIDSDVDFLLETGNFYPACEADIDAGIAIVRDSNIRRRGRKPKQ